MEKRKYVVAIDFDNTIAIDDENWQIVGIQKNCKKTIDKLKEIGCYIIIWTCREGKNLNIAEEFLKKHNIHYDKINANCPWHYDYYPHDSRKIWADVYVDDAGILGIPSWNRIYSIIEKKANEFYAKCA